MPLRIQNKEMARVEKLRKSIEREPDAGASFGDFVDIGWYHHGQLPLFIRKAQQHAALDGKPVFRSRVPGGGTFNAGPKGSETPCKLNLIDILDVKRHWVVMEDQGIKKGTMAKKFNVTAEQARNDADRHGTSHKPAQLNLRDKESLQSEVPLTYLPGSLIERCTEASHSHVPSTFFPMGTSDKDRSNIMHAAKADAEVASINTANDRGHGDLRNTQNMNMTPSRLIAKRAVSPQKLARNESSMSLMSSGTMMSNRTFASPGLPDAGVEEAGLTATGPNPMGLPYITFAKKTKPPRPKAWQMRRGSLTTVKSKGWEERDMTRSLSSLM